MSGISNHYDSMVAIQSVINAMSLTGLTGGVVIQEVCTYLDGQQALPFISISPYGPEKIGDELNYEDGCYYGIAVVIIGRKSVTSLEQRLGWRQSIRRNFNNQAFNTLAAKYSISLAVSALNYNLTVEPGNVVEPRAYFDRDAFASGLVIRASFQEPRQ